MFVFIVSDGVAIAEISAAKAAGLFVAWGVLMGVTGAALAWLLSGEQMFDENAPSSRRRYHAGRAAGRAAERGDTREMAAVGDAVTEVRAPAPPHPPAADKRLIADRTTTTIPRIADAAITVTNLLPSPPSGRCPDTTPCPRRHDPGHHCVTWPTLKRMAHR